MNTEIRLNTEAPKTTAALENVVDSKAAAEILGIKNTAELNEAARAGYIPYSIIGTAYCYDKSTLVEGWRNYQLHAAQSRKVYLTNETYEVYTRLKENNKLSDEQLFKHFLNNLSQNQ